MKNPIQQAPIRWQHYVGIFLLSSATLLLELALTRVLSVANWYHFGFLVVSTALLGFGASGATLSLWTTLQEKTPMDQALSYITLLFGIVSIVSFWLMQRISFEPLRLLVDRSQFFYMMLYYVILAAPFFCSGLAVSLLLSRGGRQVNRLYAADLLGAGLGCAAICVVMPIFGGAGSIAFAAALGALAAVAFNCFRWSKMTAVGGTVIVGTLALAFAGEQVMPIKVLPEKLEHPLVPKDETPIYTKWNSFSKVDVYHAPALDVKRPDPGFVSIILDSGGAGTGITDLSMGAREYLSEARDYHPSGVAYVGKQHPKVLIIGSGAGREVLEALYYNATSVTAVEINPIIVDLVTNRMREHWGGLYEQPQVQLVTDDGRNFVRRSKEQYDVIVSVNTFSDTALTAGALTLSETYILTREAFEDYWEHLTPNGTLLITGYGLPKLFSTTREMFAHLRLGSPANHLMGFRGTVAPFGGRRLVNCFLLQKSPLSQEDFDAIATRAGIGSIDHWSETDHPEIYYSPFGQENKEPLPVLLSALVNAPNLESVYDSSLDYLRPATDDKPFFNQTRPWRPRLGFHGVLGAGRMHFVRGSVAQVTLVVMLIQAIVVAGVMILLPLVRFDRQSPQIRGRWVFLTYFASLGLGFILIEMALLQWLLLFLGQPIYTFSIVLASLLIFTGVGSFLSGLVKRVSYRTLAVFILAAVAGILFMMIIMPSVLRWSLGLVFPWRVLLAVLLVAPLGVLLGMPFPTGLRLLNQEASPLVSWAWAVNAFFTVIGSVGAMILGMAVGFTAVFAVAAACYGAALMAILRGEHAVLPQISSHSTSDQNMPIRPHATAA
jgi:hypothetical protein